MSLDALIILAIKLLLPLAAGRDWHLVAGQPWASFCL